MYRSIARNILARSLDVFRGTKTIKYLSELEKTQWWQRGEILALQDEKLRRLVRHAYNNVPYYHRIFNEHKLKPDDIQSSMDLAKLPILTKKLIRDNFADIVARHFPRREMIFQSTGGTTGEPLRFYTTKDAYYNSGTGAELRAYGWAGYRIGAKCTLLWNSYPSGSLLDRSLNLLRLPLQRVQFFDVMTVTNEKLPLYVEKIRQFQPEFIRGFPMTLYLLARFLEKEGETDIKPRAIITSGEKLYDYQRDLLTKFFGCNVYSYYGTNEIQSIASECSEYSGLHISAENVIIEISTDKGEPVPSRQEGKVLLTNLHNYAMPFIRYENGDLGVISDDLCACGRELPLLLSISGRTADIILTRSGERIPGISLSFRPFGDAQCITQFQIVQNTLDEVVIKLVADKRYSEEYIRQKTGELNQYYQSALPDELYIRTELVEEISPAKSGKRRIVVSNITQEL